jgi:hypothetical protein
MPPGTLDKRIVFNDAIWIDTSRTSQEISSMSAQYVSAVITFLQGRAPDQYDLGPYGGDIQVWLETTPLMYALRHRLEALDEAEGTENAVGEGSPFDIFGDANTEDFNEKADLPTAACAPADATGLMAGVGSHLEHDVAVSP